MHQFVHYRIVSFTGSIFLLPREAERRYILDVLQGLLENEYVGTNFAVGEVRAISGYQAVSSAYDISSNENAKWNNLLVLFLMAVGYRFLVFVFLSIRLGTGLIRSKICRCNLDTVRNE